MEAIQKENDRLRREKEDLEKQAKQPPEQVLKDQLINNVEVEAIKGRNKEIEDMIDQVLKKDAEQHHTDKTLPQDGESIATLLRFLL